MQNDGESLEKNFTEAAEPSHPQKKLKKEGKMGAPKQKWTSEEEEALVAGVNKHGAGKWRTIQKDPEFGHCLAARSNIDLKVLTSIPPLLSVISSNSIQFNSVQFFSMLSYDAARVGQMEEHECQCQRPWIKRQIQSSKIQGSSLHSILCCSCTGCLTSSRSQYSKELSGRKSSSTIQHDDYRCPFYHARSKWI
ncbi:hypothetical protein ACLOJK_014640 [Asimina triloba]